MGARPLVHPPCLSPAEGPRVPSHYDVPHQRAEPGALGWRWAGLGCPVNARHQAHGELSATSVRQARTHQARVDGAPVAHLWHGGSAGTEPG